MSDSYYGRPIVKPHQWKPEIPLYFWLGGVAGASSTACILARVCGRHELARVYKRVALGGAMIAPVLLISDLGVRHRFYNMFRVFKPTSPMSVGSWLLAAFGGAVASSTAAEFLGWDVASVGTEAIAAILGPGLATYTAVLISNTATPVWHEARGELPFVFAASSIAGAGALAVLFAPSTEAGSARRAMIAGGIALEVAMRSMQASIGKALAEPFRTGKAGGFQSLSTLLGMAAIGLGMLGKRRRKMSCAAACLTIAAGIYERFAILEAGKQSATDPKYVVESQRS
ncbi:MAG TPA: NrfD/PsrC family molybdoenzyme membrane anchor subunit [Candidatus Acidoferrales bacterium]|nr:NrfD/PsrC family molybdoenzyme membrane anchor subunit [Candidatus Acidoferrales bacterium]